MDATINTIRSALSELGTLDEIPMEALESLENALRTEADGIASALRERRYPLSIYGGPKPER